MKNLNRYLQNIPSKKEQNTHSFQVYMEHVQDRPHVRPQNKFELT